MNMIACEGVEPDRVQRIWETADKLYDELNRERFPPVDEVRRSSSAGMHDTSKVMKNWRRVQSSKAVSEVVGIPDAINELAIGLIARCWSEAQQYASDGLVVAQRAWEDERIESEKIRSELAKAFDTQCEEMRVLNQQFVDTCAARDEANKCAESLIRRADKADAKLELLNEQLKTTTAQLETAQSAEHLLAELRARLMSAEKENAGLQKEILAIARSKSK